MKWLEVGKKGEDIACRYLEGKGHRIVDRNYRMKFGEIDVVSKKKGVLFFTEVKTFARGSENENFTHQPEENVNEWKIKKLSRVIQVYLERHKYSDDLEWEFYVIAITLDMEKKTAEVKLIKDVISS